MAFSSFRPPQVIRALSGEKRTSLVTMEGENLTLAMLLPFLVEQLPSRSHER
jgi:hypothetical protein